MKPSVAFNPERDSAEAAIFVFTFFYEAVHRGALNLLIHGYDSNNCMLSVRTKDCSIQCYRIIAFPVITKVWQLSEEDEKTLPARENRPDRDNYTDDDSYDEACYRASGLSGKHRYQTSAAVSVLNDCEDVDLLYENVLSLIEKKEYKYIWYAVMSGCSHMFDCFSNEYLFEEFKAGNIRSLSSEDVELGGRIPDSERGKRARETILKSKKEYKQRLIDVAKSLGIDQDDDIAAKLNNIINSRKEELLGQAAKYWGIDQDIESNNEEYVGVLKKHNLEYLLTRNEVLAHRDSCAKREEEAALESLGIHSCQPTTSSSGCFVATAVLNNPLHPSLITLREFRDECLLKSRNGERFVYWYYRNGPVLAKYISGKVFLRIVTKYLFVIPVSIVAKVILFVKSNRHYKH